MFVPTVVAKLFLLASLVAATQHKCADMNTRACELMAQSNPSLCSDNHMAEVACPRFCHVCPTECYHCDTTLAHYSDCNTTKLCAQHEVCMLKVVTSSVDGHHANQLSCEKKAVCDGGGLTLTVGKRGLEVRDLSIKCCENDRCNYPVSSTPPPPTSTTKTKTTATTTPIPKPTASTMTKTMTTTTATTTASTTTSSKSRISDLGLHHYGVPSLSTKDNQRACYKDIVFVVDDSGSVGSVNFRHAMDFVIQIVNQINVGPNHAHIALMEYSSHPQIEWYLKTYTTKTEVLNALLRVPYVSGISRAGDALEAVRTQMFTATNGDRIGADNAVVVLTDGQSNDHTDTIHEANNLHMIVRDVVSIVNGQGINMAEVNAIATDRQHMFDIHSYANLYHITQQVINLICG